MIITSTKSIHRCAASNFLAFSSYFLRKGANFPKQPTQLVKEGLNYAVLLQECLLIGWTLFILPWIKLLSFFSHFQKGKLEDSSRLFEGRSGRFQAHTWARGMISRWLRSLNQLQEVSVINNFHFIRHVHYNGKFQVTFLWFKVISYNKMLWGK